ncbi:hypothetical protein [Kitasatospora albolonga]|uniref:hypothetical protein n=1 Tax=Kitasatospora albolonga TaxID=68173 RepID=UPI0035E7EC6C
MRWRARWVVLVAGVLALTVGGLLLGRLLVDEGRTGAPQPGVWTLRPTAALVPGTAADRFSADYLAAGPEVVVAVGTAGGAWYSADGVTWQEGDLGSQVRGPGWGVEVSGLVRYGGGFLAVGVSVVGSATPVFGEQVAWRSADGRRWTRIEGPPAPDGARVGRPRVHTDGTRAVVAVSDRNVAVLGPQDTGWQTDELPVGDCRLYERSDRGTMPAVLSALCPGGGGEGAAKAWAALRLDGRPGSAALLRVPTGEAGTLVAVGDGSAVALVDHPLPRPGASASARASGSTEGALDGGGETEGALDGGGEAGGVLDGGGGEGASGDRMQVWVSRSVDGGVHWTTAVPLPLPEGAASGSGWPAYLEWTGHGYVATGWAEEALGYVPLIWTSTDGERWSVQRIARYAERTSLGMPVAFRGLYLVPALYEPGQRTAGLLVSGGPPLSPGVTAGQVAESTTVGTPVPSGSVPSGQATGGSVPSGQVPGDQATASQGPTLTERMAGVWGGTVAEGYPGAGGTVRLVLRAVETARGPRVLVGTLSMDNCTA